MNQPNFDDMDALMGENPAPRSKGGDAHVVDVEPVSSGLRQRKVKKSGNAGVALVLGSVAVLSLAVGGVYFALTRSSNPVVASPDVIAATLGGNAPNAALPAATQPQPQTPPVSDAANAALPAPAPGSSVPMPVAPPIPPSPEVQAELDALRAELAAAKDAKDAAEKALQEAKSKPAQVVTRDANTSFILIETLIDGAVLRDRAGNEIIVPKGSTVQVAGNRLSAGATR
jgi:hypothetical protein